MTHGEIKEGAAVEETAGRLWLDPDLFLVTWMRLGRLADDRMSRA